VLLSLLHSAGSELHPALLALLLRLLLLPHPGSYVHGSSVVLPQLHDAHGMLLGPRPTPLAECLRCQLLSFDDETLEGWLGAKLDAGPLVALVGHFSSVASAIAMITEHRELHGAAGGTGTGAGGAGAGAGAGGGSSAGGTITVWALTAQLLHALVCHERIRIDLEGAIVGELLGDRLWKVSLALLRRTFGAPTATPWSDSARELFETVRVLATTLHRLPELVDVSLDLLTSLRERHAAAASAYPAPRAVGAGVATSAAGAAVTPPQLAWCTQVSA
jgi:hypothetical protein